LATRATELGALKTCAKAGKDTNKHATEMAVVAAARDIFKAACIAILRRNCLRPMCGGQPLNAYLQKNHPPTDKQSLNTGIGINTGNPFLGHSPIQKEIPPRIDLGGIGLHIHTSRSAVAMGIVSTFHSA
jgi:hypothetical protein